jgi:hypothetical protein
MHFHPLDLRTNIVRIEDSHAFTRIDMAATPALRDPGMGRLNPRT